MAEICCFKSLIPALHRRSVSLNYNHLSGLIGSRLNYGFETVAEPTNMSYSQSKTEDQDIRELRRRLLIADAL